jgi:hypothetical protein
MHSLGGFVGGKPRRPRRIAAPEAGSHPGHAPARIRPFGQNHVQAVLRRLPRLKCERAWPGAIRSQGSRRRSHYPIRSPRRRVPLRLRHEHPSLRPGDRRPRLQRHARPGQHLPVDGQLQPGQRRKTDQELVRLSRFDSRKTNALNRFAQRRCTAFHLTAYPC